MDERADKGELKDIFPFVTMAAFRLALVELDWETLSQLSVAGAGTYVTQFSFYTASPRLAELYQQALLEVRSYSDAMHECGLECFDENRD